MFGKCMSLCNRESPNNDLNLHMGMVIKLEKLHLNLLIYEIKFWFELCRVVSIWVLLDNIFGFSLNITEVILKTDFSLTVTKDNSPHKIWNSSIVFAQLWAFKFYTCTFFKVKANKRCGRSLVAMKKNAIIMQLNTNVRAQLFLFTYFLIYFNI